MPTSLTKARSTSHPGPAFPRRDSFKGWARHKGLLIALAVLLSAFAQTLYQLLEFAWSSTLYSYIIVVPIAAGYFFWQTPASKQSRRPFILGWLLAGVGFLVMVSYWLRAGEPLPLEDALAWKMLGFVLLLGGVVALGADSDMRSRSVFALGFLAFTLPLPVAAALGIEHLLQDYSSAAAAGFFHLAGMPFFRDDTYFQLPGFSLHVAPECSGIHSTIALFITSVAAGYLCLKSPWHRAIVAAAVLPLAIVRNGFRVFVIGELCVRVGPHMIDSYIHHHGGPIFFALSMLPFGALLLWLMKRESRRVIGRR